MIGKIVCSVAGRDKGKFMVVVGKSDKKVLVCDGKERPVERPKTKNIKHIKVTKSYLDEKDFITNKALKRALFNYNVECLREEK